jgi:hypothetical protein
LKVVVLLVKELKGVKFIYEVHVGLLVLGSDQTQHLLVCESHLISLDVDDLDPIGYHVKRVLKGFMNLHE